MFVLHCDLSSVSVYDELRTLSKARPYCTYAFHVPCSQLELLLTLITIRSIGFSVEIRKVGIPSGTMYNESGAK